MCDIFAVNSSLRPPCHHHLTLSIACSIKYYALSPNRLIISGNRRTDTVGPFQEKSYTTCLPEVKPLFPAYKTTNQFEIVSLQGFPIQLVYLLVEFEQFHLRKTTIEFSQMTLWEDGAFCTCNNNRVRGGVTPTVSEERALKSVTSSSSFEFHSVSDQVMQDEQSSFFPSFLRQPRSFSVTPACAGRYDDDGHPRGWFWLICHKCPFFVRLYWSTFGILHGTGNDWKVEQCIHTFTNRLVTENPSVTYNSWEIAETKPRKKDRFSENTTPWSCVVNLRIQYTILKLQIHANWNFWPFFVQIL